MGIQLEGFMLIFVVNVVYPFLFNVYANCCKDFFCDVLASLSALNSDELISLKIIYIRSNCPLSTIVIHLPRFWNFLPDICKVFI